MAIFRLLGKMRRDHKTLWIIRGLVFLIMGCDSLRLTNMTAPLLQDPRQDMKLHCSFDMGTETLYAVKWYKDDQEFFRYTPAAMEPITQYPVVGVKVSAEETSCTPRGCDLLLTQLQRPHSSGAYRCEVSSEAPAFRLASDTHNVIVAAIPRELPRISGLFDTYNLGDFMIAECTSGQGDPRPTLAFAVNGQRVGSYALAESIVPNGRGGPTTTLRSHTIQTKVLLDRGYSKNRAEAKLWVTCNSTAEGISHALAPPLTSSRTVRLIDPSQVVKNQKLASFFGGGGGGVLQGSVGVIVIEVVVTLLSNY